MSVTRLKKPLHRRLTLGGHDVVLTLSPGGVVSCRRYRGRRTGYLALEGQFARFLRDPLAPLAQEELPLEGERGLSLEGPAETDR